jgi:magnesium transporter
MMNYHLNVLRKKIRLQRRLKDPFGVEFIGHQYLDTPDLQLISYNKNQFQEEKHIELSHVREFDERNKVYWLNVHGIHEAELIKSIGLKHGLDHFVLEDILDTTERSKMQGYDDYLFFTIKSILPMDADELETEHISFILGNNYLLSFQERKSDHFEHIRNRIRQNIGLMREKGTDFLLYMLLEAIIDNYYSTFENLETEIYQLTTIDKTDPDPDIVRKIENYKKQLYNIKKSLFPLKEAVGAIEKGMFEMVSNEQYKYFNDLKDQGIRLLENMEDLNMRLESGLNQFYSLQGHKMNQIMKTLTVIATIFIPLTFVAGVYGMNFRNMPELAWEWGYFTTWGIMIAMVVGMMIYFKKKRWF